MENKYDGAVLSCAAVCYVLQCDSNESVDEIPKCGHAIHRTEKDGD